MTPNQVIEEVKLSNIRGRGGAGFPTGLKWEFCSKAAVKEHFVICNADEGETGYFQRQGAANFVPSNDFRRYGYRGLRHWLKAGHTLSAWRIHIHEGAARRVLKEMRANKQLGKDIEGIKGFDFEIRLQMGSGAYVCGEETALIESAEGKRGEPETARLTQYREDIWISQALLIILKHSAPSFISLIKLSLVQNLWNKEFIGHKIVEHLG